MKNSIIESIESLPPLSKTISDINRVHADEDASISDLAKVIELDPMIVANLLKAANSPLYGFAREIKNVSQAVSLFGMSVTRTIALGNSVRKLLNVDMQPYGISSQRFAEISSLQANFMFNWYKKIDKKKAEKLYLAAFLQETGKIIIASEIIQRDEVTSFQSEVAMSNNLAVVEIAYVDMSSAEVTALIFKHWGFDEEFIAMIKFADTPALAPEDIKEFSIALHIVKTIIPLNKPFSEVSINFGLKFAVDAGYDSAILEESINKIKEILKGNN